MKNGASEMITDAPFLMFIYIFIDSAVSNMELPWRRLCTAFQRESDPISASRSDICMLKMLYTAKCRG